MSDPDAAQHESAPPPPPPRPAAQAEKRQARTQVEQDELYARQLGAGGVQLRVLGRGRHVESVGLDSHNLLRCPVSTRRP